MFGGGGSVGEMKVGLRGVGRGGSLAFTAHVLSITEKKEGKIIYEIEDRKGREDREKVKEKERGDKER